LNRKVQLAFGSAILALLLVGAVYFRGMVVSRESDRRVRHTHEILGRLQDLLSAMQSVESGYSGFALTGNESYLESYHAGLLSAEQDEAAVRNLTVDNPEQQGRIPILEKLVDQKIQYAETVIALRRAKSLEAAADAIRSGQGQHIMDEFQGIVRELQDEELRLLVLRDADAKRRLGQTKTTLILVIVLGSLIASAAGWSVQRDTFKRGLAEGVLRDSEVRFRQILESAPDAMVIADAQGRIVLVNAETERMFDYRRDELVGQPVEILVPEPDRKSHLQHRQAYTAHPRRRSMDESLELRGLRKDATEFPVEISLSPLEIGEGIFVMAAIRDVSVRKDADKHQAQTDDRYSKLLQAEEALWVEKERAQVTLDCIGDAVVCTDISGNVTFLNLMAEKMTGWLRQEAAGLPMAKVFRIMDATSHEITANPMDRAIDQNRTVHLPPNCILLRRDGFEIPIEDSVAPIRDRQGQPTGAVIVFRDVSVARAMAVEMAHSAEHDFLTGLPNRLLLNDRVSQSIAFAQRHAKKVAVLFLDLDGFKHINDSLGHPVGDKLLQSVAKRLADCVRGSDTVSRQGGDEFVVLLSEVEHSEDAAITARRMLQMVAKVHSIDQHDLFVTASIGLSIYPDDGPDVETLIKNADTAMYQAKEDGRQSYQFFEPAMNVRAVERQSIEESLRRAVERKEFTLYYQPKINLRTGEITGAEALLRWTHPTLGSVSPARFIPVAEDCGLILPVGQWVLREACKQAQAWVHAGLPPATMAVNISAIEFRDVHFLEGVFAILEETGLDPSSLELELTESVLMKHADSTESILKALRARGVQVAIDDFGTGYSSLSYLRKFPIDALKIDQSFVRQITAAPGDTTIVTAVISMGRSLNLRVIAEGVETQQELTFLQAHQCDEAQGYYFSRPVVAQQFAKLLEAGIPQPVLY